MLICIYINSKATCFVQNVSKNFYAINIGQVLDCKYKTSTICTRWFAFETITNTRCANDTKYQNLYCKYEVGSTNRTLLVKCECSSNIDKSISISCQLKIYTQDDIYTSTPIPLEKSSYKLIVIIVISRLFGLTIICCILRCICMNRNRIRF